MRTRRHLVPSIVASSIVVPSIVAALAAALVARADAPPATVPATSPTTGPADAATLFILEQRGAIADNLAKADPIPARRIEDLIRLSVEDGRLVATLLPPDVGDRASLPLVGGEGSISIGRLHARDDPTLGALDFEYLRLDAADVRHPRATFLQLMTDVRGVSLTLNEQSPSFTTNADLIDHAAATPGADEPPIASLRFNRTSEADAGETQTDDQPAADDRGAYLPTANFTALLDAHHDAVVNAMGEALTSLRAMHVLSGLSDAQARQLMNSGNAVDPDVARGVAGIVDALRADGSTAVDASATRLAALGPAAVGAMNALDRKAWSPDLKLCVDTVLAQVATLPASRVQLLLATPARLIDLLYWPDVAVRRASAERLGPTLGKEWLATFDAEKDPYAQATLIEAARATLPHAGQ